MNFKYQRTLNKTFFSPMYFRSLRTWPILVFLGTFISFSPLSADPWGKDADLAYQRPQPPVCCTATPSLLAKMGEACIRFHQDVISPADGPRSHFIPSSSQYTLDAMQKYGFFKGYTMGCDRLMRENSDPWFYPKINDPAGNSMKWDPVK